MIRKPVWHAVIILICTICACAFSGCGGGPTPKEPQTSAKEPSHGKTRAPQIKFDPIDFPKEVMKDLETNIKEWATKKGHFIGFDKGGKAVVQSQKGRKVKVPFTVLPPNEKLSKDVLDKIEARTKEWAEKKGYTTGKDKNGRMVGKNAKDKNVPPPFEIFLPELPDSFVIASGPAPTGKSPTASGTDDDKGDDSDPDD